MPTLAYGKELFTLNMQFQTYATADLKYNFLQVIKVLLCLKKQPLYFERTCKNPTFF